MNLFSFIKERISIVDLVNEYVTLRRAGGYYKGTCPFHYEKTASFTVSPDKHIFYCFGCHISGDVISFIAKVENCTQKEAAHLLAEKYSLEIPKSIALENSEKSTEEKNRYFKVCAQVALWCQEQLAKNNPLKKYLIERGFNNSTVETFAIGYFPSGPVAINSLLHALKKESLLAKDLMDAHILMQGQTTLYSPFEERLIFPIQDAQGRYCGFGGRTFKPQDTRAKYYNSRENDYFIKGTLLFNLNRAKKSIQETNNVFLVEGYTDCMAMVQNNFPNTIATLGTACTIEHLKLLSRYAERLFVVYDNDAAGKNAVLRLTHMCWQVNLELKVIILPSGQDPASFLQHNHDITPLIQQSQDIFFFFIDTIGESFLHKPLSQKLNIVRSLLTVIATLSDSLKKDILLQKAAHIFDIPFTSLRQELSRLENIHEKNERAQQPVIAAPHDELGQETTLDKRIFCAIVNNTELLAAPHAPLILNYLPPVMQAIITQLKQAQEKSSSFTFSSFFDTLSEKDKHYIGKLLLEYNEKITAQEFDNLLLQLQKKQWKTIVHDIKAQLSYAQQSGNQEQVETILRNFIDLQNTLLHTDSTTKKGIQSP